MGQVQFMPSSYLKFAEDFDGDGRRDIWAYAGRRLRVDRELSEGPRLDGGQTWGREVNVSPAAARRSRNE